ncbi:transposase [Pseudomonas stutzeri]|uniref:REP-associated tyrosine transposase n=1 Tax=Stutzerimonas stutzeri TaxID=316 RepID=UPI00210C0E42|nr:transposase [Stutzerimonas stutzeri]MCQ4312154.1 transposase [Stutzerimonas stutzeri]
MSNYRRSQVPGGTWFFTVTLADRQSRLLIEEIALLRHAYRQAQRSHPFQTLAICVLPDHLHAIWTLPEGDADFAGRWSLLKSSFSRQLPATPRNPSQLRKREKGIWQRRYWEHQIRDALDLQRHVDYIHFNSVKHGLVERAADWPYSSFNRYVEKGLLPHDWAGGTGADGSFGE